MNVVFATGIYAQIEQAINSAEEANQVIERIELSEEEMRQFLTTPRFKYNVDKNYGEQAVSVPTAIDGARAHNGLAPRSCMYRGVQIVVKEA